MTYVGKVPLSGLEPETYTLEVCCSIQLSYKGMCSLQDLNLGPADYESDALTN